MWAMLATFWILNGKQGMEYGSVESNPRQSGVDNEVKPWQRSVIWCLTDIWVRNPEPGQQWKSSFRYRICMLENNQKLYDQNQRGNLISLQSTDYPVSQPISIDCISTGQPKAYPDTDAQVTSPYRLRSEAILVESTEFRGCKKPTDSGNWA